MTRKRQSTMRACILCAEYKGMTYEDAVPKWLGPILSPGRYTGTLDGVPFDKPKLVARHRQVCQDCNGWMNKTFENPARPILKRLIAGDSFVLGGTDQLHVAGWLAKTDLMMDPTYSRPVIPPDIFLRFRREGLTDSIAVFIGHFREGESSPPTVPPSDAYPPEIRHLADCSGHTTTYGRLFAHVFICRHAVSVKHPLEDAGFLVRIWPRRWDEIVWPPELSMNINDFERIKPLFFG